MVWISNRGLKAEMTDYGRVNEEVPARGHFFPNPNTHYRGAHFANFKTSEGLKTNTLFLIYFCFI